MDILVYWSGLDAISNSFHETSSGFIGIPKDSEGMSKFILKRKYTKGEASKIYAYEASR